MQFPDSLLSGKINLSITGHGSFSGDGEYFMPVQLRSERFVRDFFDSHKLITVGEICEYLHDNLRSDHPAVLFRAPTREWCVFVQTTHFNGVGSHVEYKVLPKESLLLEIHPYILNNFKIEVSMTPEHTRAFHPIVEGDATPEYLLRSAKISSNSRMEESYQKAVKELEFWNKTSSNAKARGGEKNESVHEPDDEFLQDAIARFEEHKLTAIRVHNDIKYTSRMMNIYNISSPVSRSTS